MRPFQLSLRFIVPLALVLGAFALVMLPLIDELTERWFLRDLDSRSQVLAASLREPMADLVSMQDAESIQALLDRSAHDAHTRAIAFCDTSGRLLHHSSGFPSGLSCQGSAPPGLRVAEVPLDQEGITLGKLVLAQDLGFIERRATEFRNYLLAVFLMMFIRLMRVIVSY